MNWHTGSDELIEFDQIIKLVSSHYKNGGTIHIGTDSHLKQQKCIFSTAICLIGGPPAAKNIYFITRRTTSAQTYITLIQRITEEVQKSISIGLKLLAYCPKIDIELHLDISAEHKNEGTSQFSQMLIGYANGSGFNCKIKPNAFAASSVADKYSKVFKRGIINENKSN